MTWAAGDSQPEKFETPRGFYVASYYARKRPEILAPIRARPHFVPVDQEAVSAGGSGGRCGEERKVWK